VPPLDFDAARKMCSVDGRLNVTAATLAVVCDAGLPTTSGTPADPRGQRGDRHGTTSDDTPVTVDGDGDG
jgi:hypothetical protein